MHRTPAQQGVGGVWATILLDVRDDGDIDLDAIDGQIAAFRAAGCDGVYTNGTAAEFHSQTEPQFREVSRRAAAAAARHAIPVQLGATHPLPQGSLERIAFAATLGPAAIQVTLPDWTAIDLATARRFLAGAAGAAACVPLVLYNPPHARTVLLPGDLVALADAIPALSAVKCGGGDAVWYRAMHPAFARLSVMIPGHHYASGTAQGAHGSYSNMACLSPPGAVRWARLARRDPSAAAELEVRVAAFMEEAIAPLLAAGHPGFACDKAMAAAGGWTRITPRFLWPYPPVPDAALARIRAAAARHIPEFLASAGGAHA